MASREKKAQIAAQNTFVGQVVSDKMDKTVVIEVTRSFRHPRLHKIMRSSKKYKVHDEKGEARVGDIVECHMGRPVSKTKYLYLSRVVKSAAQTASAATPNTEDLGI